MILQEILYRDEPLAKREAGRGMHHTTYLRMVTSRLLKQVGIESSKSESDPVHSGAGWCVIIDPVTNLEYELRVTPLTNGKVRS